LVDLQQECENIIEKNINHDNIEIIQKIAESLNSKKIIEDCKIFLKNNKTPFFD
jgi:hypothetical protein